MTDPTRKIQSEPASAATPVWTLIPTGWESLEARTLKGWSLDELAARASVSSAALIAYEREGDVLPIGGPGLRRLRRAFEAVGLIFDKHGLHELERPAPPTYDPLADAQMIHDSYLRFAELHAQRQTPN